MKINQIVTLAVLLVLAGCAPGLKSGTAQNALDGPATCGCYDPLSGIPDRVFFAFDSAMLTNQSTETLRKQEAIFINRPTLAHVNLVIAGNADERGTETYNLALGQKRADAARDDLVAQGVASTRITTVSYGKDKPVATGHDEASWQQNRNAITSVVGFNPQGN